jgi:hypothetical protein
MDLLHERISLADIQNNFGQEIYQQAKQLFDSGAVIDLGFQKKDYTAWGIILDKKEEYHCRAKFDKEHILISCPCENIVSGHPCVHVITLLIGWVTDREYFLEDLDRRPFNEMFAEDSQAEEKSSSTVAQLSLDEIINDYRQKLDYYTVGQLRDLAGRRGVKISGQRRENILTTLSSGLAQAGNMLQAVNQLTPFTRKVFDLLWVISDGQDQIQLRWVMQVLDSTLAEKGNQLKIEEALGELLQMGLAFTINGRVNLPKQVAAFHDQNSELVRLHPGPEEAGKIVSPADFGQMTSWVALLSQLDVLECLPEPANQNPGNWPESPADNRSTFREKREKVLLPEGSYLKPEVLKRLGSVTGQPGVKIDYLVRLLVQGRFWKGKVPRDLSPAFIHWLQADPSAQMRELFDLAVTLETPVELDFAREAGKFKILRDSFLQFSYRSFLQSIQRARRLFFRLLTLFPVNTWVDLESVLQLMHGLAQDFLLNNNNPRLLWLELKDIQVKINQFDEWRKSYGLFYQAILTGPAQWMGICQIGLQGGTPAAFQITPFGHFLLSEEERYPFPTPLAVTHPISFRKDGVILLNPADAGSTLIHLLLLIAQIDPAYPQGSGQVKNGSSQQLAFKVRNEGIGRAFKAGWTPEKIQEKLRNASDEPFPAFLDQLLHLCWERYGRLHIYSDMALIQLGDEFCLPELLAGTQLGQNLLYQFSPTLIAVKPESIEEIINELRVKGYTPRVMERPLGRNIE